MTWRVASSRDIAATSARRASSALGWLVDPLATSPTIKQIAFSSLPFLTGSRGPLVAVEDAQQLSADYAIEQLHCIVKGLRAKAPRAR